MASDENDILWMEDEGPKSEAEILDRIATLYAQLDDVREQQRREEAPGGDKANSKGPRVILVTRRLPRDALDETKPKIDAMDQALCNFRQVTSSGRNVTWVGRPEIPTTGAHDGEQRAIRERLLREGRYAPVFLDPKKERLFYSGYCKRVLWPLFHSSPPTTRDVVARARQPPIQGQFCPFYKGDDDESADTRQLWQAYKAVNRAYADVVHDVAEEGDLIWIQDYHFMLLPQMLRALDADAKLGFFLHVPFPSSELYRMLPYREEILHGLLAADLLGFQTYDYARHFLSSCEIILGIETSPDRIEHDGHQTRVCVCPVGIEPDAVRMRAKQTSTALAIQRLESQLSGRTLVLGVDTLDPTKGLVHKFLAIEELFNEHPELADQIMFVQVILGGASAVPDDEEAGGGPSNSQAAAARNYDTLTQPDDDDDVGSEDDTIVANDDADDFLRQRQQHNPLAGGSTSSRWQPGAPIAASSRGGAGGVPLAATSNVRPSTRLHHHHAAPRSHSHGLFYASSNSSSTDLSGSARRAQAYSTAGRPKERLERAHRRYYARGVFTTLERQLHSMVSRINSKLASLDFEGPVQYLNVAQPEADEDNLAALFSLADILVCTPIRDGMNVVPFEYLVARDAAGKFATVLLSEFAGCARSLGGAVLINPWDTTNFASVLHRLVKEARAANARDARRRAARIMVTSGSKTSSSRLDVNVGTVSSGTLDERTSSSPDKSIRRAVGNDVHEPTGFVHVSSRGCKLKQRSLAVSLDENHSFLSPSSPSGRHSTSRTANSQVARVTSQTSAVEASDDDSDDEDDDDDEGDEEDDDDENEVVHQMVPPSVSLAGVDDNGSIRTEGAGAVARTSSLAVKLPRSSTQRSRGVERRRAHEHMLQYVSTFTAGSWADRFLHQLQEASETKASRTLCREIKVSQLEAPYYKTKRRLLVFGLEGVLAKPCALPELLVVPPETLEHVRTICRDDANRMVVIMSARSAEVLERLFAPILMDGDTPTNLVLAAEEGLAIKWGPTLPFEMQVSAFDVDLSWQVDASPLIEYYTERTPGSVVEMKESGVAWHYRDCDLNHGAWQARQLQVALGELAKHVPLSVFSGDKCIEVRPMRLSVPNVLEAALRRIRKRDIAEGRDDADDHAPRSTLGSPTSAESLERESAPAAAFYAGDGLPVAGDRANGDVAVPDADSRRGVDFVLFVASGNGLVDEEIFESMAPPPFDLDEFCFRVQKLSEGEKLEDVVMAPAAAKPISEQIRSGSEVETKNGGDVRAKVSPRPTRSRSFSFDSTSKRDRVAHPKISKLRSPSIDDAIKDQSIADDGARTLMGDKGCMRGFVQDSKSVESDEIGSSSDPRTMRRFHSKSLPLDNGDRSTTITTGFPSKTYGTPSPFADEVETLTSAPAGTFDGERIKGTGLVHADESMRGARQTDPTLPTQAKFGSGGATRSRPQQGTYETALGPAAAIFEQFAAVMTEPEIDGKKAIPDQVRERLKRKKSSFVAQTGSNPAALPRPSAQPESQSDTLRRANVAARQDFQPRRDYPPTAMLFQAIRRRYGRDWSRPDLPTTASACWALVEGRTPRPGAPKAERSTFLADFEDLRGVHSPDVVLPHQTETFDQKEAHVEPSNPTKRSASQPPRIRRVESVGDCEHDMEKSDVASAAAFSRGLAKVLPKPADLSELSSERSAQASHTSYPRKSDVDGSDSLSSSASTKTNDDMQKPIEPNFGTKNCPDNYKSHRIAENAGVDAKSATIGDSDQLRSSNVAPIEKAVDTGGVRPKRDETLGLVGSSPRIKQTVGRQSQTSGTVLDHAVEMNALALSRALMRNQIPDEDNSAQYTHPRYSSIESVSGVMPNGLAHKQQTFRKRSHRSSENLYERREIEESHHQRTGSLDTSHDTHLTSTQPSSAKATNFGFPQAQPNSTSTHSSRAIPVGNSAALGMDETSESKSLRPEGTEEEFRIPSQASNTDWAPAAADVVFESDHVNVAQDREPIMKPEQSESKHAEYLDSVESESHKAFRPTTVDLANTIDANPSSTDIAANPQDVLADRSANDPRKAIFDISAAQADRWRLHSGWEAPNDQVQSSFQRISRLRTRTVTPPPPGARPMYVSHASRGAMTEQERREFDRAGRVASAAAKASLQRDTVLSSTNSQVVSSSDKLSALRMPKRSDDDAVLEDVEVCADPEVDGYAPRPTNISSLASRTSIASQSSPPLVETAEPQRENGDEENGLDNASDRVVAESDSFQNHIDTTSITATAELSKERHRGSRSRFNEFSSTKDEPGESYASGEVPSHGLLSPVTAPDRSEPPPPPMASLAAAAAAAADDSYGLDLPLQTFSCTVGIKLSQATYYLKSSDMIHTWLDRIGSVSAVSSPKSRTSKDA